MIRRTAPPGSNPVASVVPTESFITDHLALAAFLASCGHAPKLVAMPNGRVLFTFTSTPSLQAAVVAFNDGTAQVQPASYDAARIQLRRQMDALFGGGR